MSEIAEPVVITDAATFERWWQRRDFPNDQHLKQAAYAACLVEKAGGLLFLTPAGSLLRREGERLRGVVPRRRK